VARTVGIHNGTNIHAVPYVGQQVVATVVTPPKLPGVDVVPTSTRFGFTSFEKASTVAGAARCVARHR
jgi:hypothetical protein